ncbi:MAG: hypothetical protein KGL39_09800 [Patescibacteria group bacterium]|nr:hypothetical protein [Patescibacteria group bacterium]
MANIYVNYGDGSTTGYYAVAKFAINTAYSSTSNGGRGDYIRQLTTPSVGNERVFRCTTSGTSGASEPSWTLTKNGTTTSGTVVFTECTGQELDQGPAASVWTAPHARLANAFASGWSTAGDSLFVASNHAETQAAVLTITSPGTAASPCYVYCVTQTTIPPTSANLTTGGTLTTTGSNELHLSGGYTYMRGITFNCAVGDGSGYYLVLGYAASCLWYLDSCTLIYSSSNSGSGILVGYNTPNLPVKIVLDNTTIQFANAGQSIQHNGGNFIWKNTSSAIAGATPPTTLFKTSSFNRYGGRVLLEGVDLSALGSGKTLVGAGNQVKDFYFKDCKLGASVTIAATPTSPLEADVNILRVDSAGTNYRHEKYQYMGTQVVETTIIRTGGASNGTTGLSWNLTTTANSKWILPFEALPIAIWNSTTAANVTATLEGIWNAAALPNNDDFWFDVEYLGSASNPQGTFKTGSKGDNLATGSALTASTQAWDSLVTARANTTAYTLGQTIKVSSNPGRVFFCTTAGTSAGSEPAGYASAVDGGSVTDGTAVFRAGVRFKLGVTMTSPQPAQVGTVYVYPKAAKVSSTFYIDPLIGLA